MSGTYTSKITSDFEREYYINAAIDNMKQQIKNGYVTGADAAKIKNALKSHEASVEYVMEKLPWLNTRVAPERQKILYANIKRPIIIDAGGASWNNLPINQLP